MAADHEAWVRTAERDLRVARLTLADGVYEAAVFHAHQAAENALKALWIARTSALPPRTHNLPELAAGLSAPAHLQAHCRALNPHYTASRYPDAANGNPADNYDEPAAKGFVDMADEVLQWCLGQLTT